MASRTDNGNFWRSLELSFINSEIELDLQLE